MAIIRNVADEDNPINYVASAAYLCCASMVVLGLFGFYAKIKVASSRSKDEDVPVVCINGAYRSKREDFFENGNHPGPPKKITPSMVTLPLNGSVRPSKSTNDVREPEFVPVVLNKSTPDISLDPRGGSTHNAEVELRNPRKKEDKDKKKKLEKKRHDEQKAREKAAQELEKKQAKEKAKQDKEKAKQDKEKAKQDKERAKIEKEQAKIAKSKEKKGKAPPLPTSPPPPPLPSSNANTIIIETRQPLGQTNSLRSDINRSSGPPPYSELPENRPPQASTSNVSFGKPIDNTPSSWDMVSQHRQQMARPTATIVGAKKQMVMDLQYNSNNSRNDSGKDNSEA